MGDPAFTDTAARNQVTWPYTVTAANCTGAGAASVPVAAMPKGENLPAPWDHADVGQVGKPGSARYTPPDKWGQSGLPAYANRAPAGRAAAAAHDHMPHIRPIGEEKLDPKGRKRHPARRGVVERTLGWLRRCRGLLVRYARKSCHYLGPIQLACALLWYRRQD